MNFVVFNKDGSIKNIGMAEIIVQGDNLTDRIAVAVEGYSNDAYTCVAHFLLPNGDDSSLTGTAYSFNVDGNAYQGYSILLTSVETFHAGTLGMSIALEGTNDFRPVTYQVDLTVNESAYDPDYTGITAAQYQNLITTISSLQQKYVVNNARFYFTLQAAQADLENLALNQMVIVANPADPSYRANIYFKNAQGELEFLNNVGVGISDLELRETTDLEDRVVYTLYVTLDDGTIINAGTIDVIKGAVCSGVTISDPVATVQGLTYTITFAFSDGSSYPVSFLAQRGPQGEKGDRGDEGPRGYRGEQGTSVTGVTITASGSSATENYYLMTVTFSDGTTASAGTFSAQRGDSITNAAMVLVSSDDSGYTYKLRFTLAGTSTVDTNTFVIPVGPQGPRGPEGPQGVQGEQGIQGIQGIQGDKGDKGDAGDPFRIYRTYASVSAMNADIANVPEGKYVLISTVDPTDSDNGNLYIKGSSSFSFVVDMTGPQGPQGIQGAQGIQGVQGPQGIQGEQGPQGERGPQGIQGPAGADGTSISVQASEQDCTQIGQGYIDQTTGHLMILTSLSPRTFTDAGLVRGPKGDQGPQGPQGDPGTPGAQGQQGQQGDPFSIYQTYASTTAMNADASNVPQGKYVIINNTSDASDPDNGKLYVKGASAFEFVVNMKGPQGIQGIQGSQGDEGPQGDKGDKGDTGDPFSIFKTYSTIASMNADAANVPEGKYVLISSSDPTDNGKLYVKGASSFTFIVNMQGPQGPQGLQGAAGEDGSPGAKGDKGDQGDAGVSVTALSVGTATPLVNGNQYELTVTFSNSTTASAGTFVAPTGPAGTYQFDNEPTQNSINLVDSGHLWTYLQGFQATLTFDSTPTPNSNNPVTSQGIYAALSTFQPILTFDTAPTANSTNPVTSGGIYTAIKNAEIDYLSIVDGKVCITYEA